jgi:hypothetical protein
VNTVRNPAHIEEANGDDHERPTEEVRLQGRLRLRQELRVQELHLQELQALRASP